MKKLVMTISLMMAFSMMVAPAVMADTIITAGDYVELISYNSLDSAGIMTYAVKDNNGNAIGTYQTFCIQDNVYINQSVWYLVKSVSTTVGPSGLAKGDGTLQGAVGYLFYQYKTGAYSTYLTNPTVINGVTYTALQSQADFQELLWNIQGTYPTTSPYTLIANTPWGTDYQTYLSKGLTGLYGTLVINIVDSSGNDVQNQLYNAVPEPSTLLLLGFGLIGLAGVRRKKFQE